jgi:hypothetical protein
VAPESSLESLTRLIWLTRLERLTRPKRFTEFRAVHEAEAVHKAKATYERHRAARTPYRAVTGRGTAGRGIRSHRA